MEVGEDSHKVEYPARLPDFSSPLQTLSNTLPLLATLDDLLTPCIVQWYAPYLYGKNNTSSDFSSTALPPSYLATENMAHF